MTLEDAKNSATPKILYHYTSQDGLIGILKDRNLWASKIHYMNDSKEFSQTLHILGRM